MSNLIGTVDLTEYGGGSIVELYCDNEQAKQFMPAFAWLIQGEFFEYGNYSTAKDHLKSSGITINEVIIEKPKPENEPCPHCKRAI